MKMNYTRSTAVISIIGYIFGIGDRHASNIMFDKKTSVEKVIQFGEGGFLRGFVDWMLQYVNEKTDFSFTQCISFWDYGYCC